MDTIDLRRSPLREDRLQLEERAEPVAGAENSCDNDDSRLDPNDPRCGIWFFRPNCLQHFRTPKWVLFWLCWASAIQGMFLDRRASFAITKQQLGELGDRR